MRAQSLRKPSYGVAAVVVGLALAGCGTDTADDTAPKAVARSTPAATATVQSEPVPPRTTGTEQQPEDTYVPPELALMPPDEEVDRMVADAEEAYRAHWAAYDAAARTGFADPTHLDPLLASAGEDTLEALRLQVAAIGDTGRVVEGETAVVGLELYALNPPEEDRPGLGVLFDACVRTQGVLRESDGTAVRELSGAEPEFVRARLVDHEGSWLLVSQVLQGGACPDGLVDRDIDD